MWRLFFKRSNLEKLHRFAKNYFFTLFSLIFFTWARQKKNASATAVIFFDTAQTEKTPTKNAG